MSIFEKIAERKIEQAMAQGEFDNLSCKGKPLPPMIWQWYLMI
jgi:hypothetical protein